MKKNNILIVDDNAEFRRQLKIFLLSESDINVLGEASNGIQAISKTLKLKPDFVLMDVSMPVLNGLEATKKILAMVPEARVVMLSNYDVEEYRQAARETGAVGYVIKKNVVNELLPTINRLLSNGKS